MKNNTGTKSATGLMGSGVRDWVVQRISAVVLAVYALAILGFFLFGTVDFLHWRAFIMSLPMRLFSLVAIVALSAHAWIGMWTVFTDYLTRSKLGNHANGLRFVAQALCVVAILVYLFWGVMIFWGAGVPQVF